MTDTQSAAGWQRNEAAAVSRDSGTAAIAKADSKIRIAEHLNKYLCLDDFEEAARGKLPRMLYGYAASGTETAQGTLVSPTGYVVNFIPGSVSFTSTAVPRFTSFETRSGLLSDLHTDVYGRNLASPFICTAASLIKDGVAVEQRADPLASEWGKVRSQPQLSGCLDVTAGGQCSAF